MGQISKTIQILVTASISAGALMLGTGCDMFSSKPTTQANAGIRGDVTDVRPIEPAAPAAYQPPIYDTSAVIPTAPQPVTGEPIMASSTTTTVVSTTLATAKKHTVLHGETLFSIARASYGDGKQWTKIVSANPGLSPSALKVGQVIAMP